ncbi:putative quinol monooxygenase [Mycobacterium kyogaense]|uniref:putative quinol monooxygenase n=1 Tax=Mycobacterium kyogaense TaxID=2212479 RepID=UPI0013C4E75D|nr:putative quinol monooxygenase [Mycobacterium kyogaense]
MAHNVVISRIRIKDGQREAALEALREEIVASHEEDGVLKFTLHEHPDNPLELLAVEVYRTPEDIATHYRQPHCVKLISRMGELFDGVPTADRFVSLSVGTSAKGVIA